MKFRRKTIKSSLKQLVSNVQEWLAPILDKYRHKGAYFVTALIALVLIVLGINVFVELTETLKTEYLGTIDSQITQFVFSFRSSTLTDFFIFVTNIGDVNGYLVILALMVLATAFIYKKWKYVGQIFLVLLLATTSNMVLKRFIDRARPDLEHIVTVETLSYPSGHAMSAMAFYGFLIYLLHKFRIKPLVKNILIVLVSLLILSIGVSRIYLGVHFPSDILGGFIAGAIWVFFCILLFNLMELFRKDSNT
ncbi:phosphatase PAP2 family protein [Muricauda sp. HICW]|uniref:Phosphatase PAP2 family protein n=1 Tax=Flagellimonas chongwuensis TaxID=2697365 RepID=A0A850NI01_9FLAO|nr:MULTISPECIES: phosphatase PAP2 family protein [Allomuricauda]NVN19409.1 phosphatase PAP2 family protein [Allomuricauda chongwuensis]